MCRNTFTILVPDTGEPPRGDRILAGASPRLLDFDFEDAGFRLGPEGLAVAVCHAALFLIFPMRGNAALRNPMHLLRPNLKFDVFAFGTDHSRMDRLVQIGFWNRDVVFEPPRNRAPQRVDYPQRVVALGNTVHEDANRQQVVNLVRVEGENKLWKRVAQRSYDGPAKL